MSFEAMIFYMLIGIGKGHGVFYLRFESVIVVILMMFSNRLESWAAFEVGCVGTLVEYAFGWTISIIGAVFCMIKIVPHLTHTCYS
jgi:hypothetical protein